MKVKLGAMLEGVMSGLADSIRDSDAAMDAFLEHRVARACQESDEFKSLLNSLRKNHGVEDIELGMLAGILEFCITAGYLLREADLNAA